MKDYGKKLTEPFHYSVSGLHDVLFPATLDEADAENHLKALEALLSGIESDSKVTPDRPTLIMAKLYDRVLTIARRVSNYSTVLGWMTGSYLAALITERTARMLGTIGEDSLVGLEAKRLQQQAWQLHAQNRKALGQNPNTENRIWEQLTSDFFAYQKLAGLQTAAIDHRRLREQVESGLDHAIKHIPHVFPHLMVDFASRNSRNFLITEFLSEIYSQAVRRMRTADPAAALYINAHTALHLLPSHPIAAIAHHNCLILARDFVTASSPEKKAAMEAVMWELGRPDRGNHKLYTEMLKQADYSPVIPAGSRSQDYWSGRSLQLN